MALLVHPFQVGSDAAEVRIDGERLHAAHEFNDSFGGSFAVEWFLESLERMLMPRNDLRGDTFMYLRSLINWSVCI